MTEAPATTLIPAERVRAQIVAVLAFWAMGEDAIHTTVDAMVATDLYGVPP